MRLGLLFSLGGLLLLSLIAAGRPPSPLDPSSSIGALSVIEYDEPRKLCDLSNPVIRESSGLAVSRRHPDIFWTHNDSGDQPRIFAFDRSGNDLGCVDVPQADARDWEDMASFQMGGRSLLLLCDVGNNRTDHSDGTLYLVEEPLLPQEKQAHLVQRVQFRYAGGQFNCEAVAFDPIRSEVLLVTKEIRFSARVFLMAWPTEDVTNTLTAHQIGTIHVPLVTAMDVSPDGTRAVVLSYAHAYEYTREPHQRWDQAFATAGRLIRMPPRRQGESICYGHDGRSLYLTSEKRPTPLFEVSPTQ